MKLIECEGSAREIGRTTGEALRDEIREHLDRFPVPADPDWTNRLAVMVDALAQAIPQVLEEMQGTAEGADLPVESIYGLNLPRYANDLVIEEGCTNIVFRDGPDGPVWGKNNDGQHAELNRRRPVCARRITRDGCIPQVTFTFAGMLATTDAMNAEGLTVGHSSVGSIFQQSDLHVPIRLWAYEALFQTRTTEEFVHFMARRPLRGKGYAIVVVDCHGDACSIEAPCPLIQVRMPVHKAGLNCVNRYQLPHLAEADRRTPEAKCNAQARAEKLDRMLTEIETTDASAMQIILKDHGSPGICRHGKEGLSHTEYAMIGLPAQRKILYLQGYPCQETYREFTF